MVATKGNRPKGTRKASTGYLLVRCTGNGSINSGGLFVGGSFSKGQNRFTMGKSCCAVLGPRAASDSEAKGLCLLSALIHPI